MKKIGLALLAALLVSLAGCVIYEGGYGHGYYGRGYYGRGDYDRPYRYGDPYRR